MLFREVDVSYVPFAFLDFGNAVVALSDGQIRPVDKQPFEKLRLKIILSSATD